MKKLPEIEIPASGKPKWSGGAWTITFVYSNRGNFVLKGFYKETQDWLEKEKSKGLKYFCNHALYGGTNWISDKTQSRNIWSTYNRCIRIYEPSKSDKKWRVVIYDGPSWNADRVKEMTFKRLPNKWISEFEYNKQT